MPKNPLPIIPNIPAPDPCGGSAVPDFSTVPTDAELVDIPTLARVLGCSVAFIKKHHKNIIGSYKLGRMRLFHLPTIRAQLSLMLPILTTQTTPKKL